ncbi:MAG: hypothetical protein U0231_08975 [Nitrospiraceae bacterium]
MQMWFPKRWPVLLSILVAGVYLSLTLMAAGCLMSHAAESGHHDHHAAGNSGSLLCAVSCQATSDSDLVLPAPTGIPLATAFIIAPSTSADLSAEVASARQPRAPPVPALG